MIVDGHEHEAKEATEVDFMVDISSVYKLSTTLQLLPGSNRKH